MSGMARIDAAAARRYRPAPKWRARMELVVPEILAEVRQLSTVLCGLALVVGVALWVAGWWSHRFWIVLAFTVLGGVWGLQNAEGLYAQPLVAAIGVALGAGILALTLVRLVAFAAGGYTGLLLVHALSPTWDQPLISFLAGGLLGFFLFRYWTMALTSVAGVVLMTYSALALADQYGKIEALPWAAEHTSTLNGVCGLMAVSGFALQLLSGYWWKKKGDSGSKNDKKSGKKDKASLLETGLAAFRKAG
jgi:hypothetical protein